MNEKIKDALQMVDDGQYAAAITLLSTINDKCKDWHDAHVRCRIEMAWKAIRKPALSEALLILERVGRGHRNNAWFRTEAKCYEEMAWRFFKEKKFAAGLETLNKVHLASRNDNWLYLCARCEMGLRKFNEVEQLLARVQNKTHKSYVLFLARFQKEKGQLQEAIATVQSFYQDQPIDDEASLHLIADCQQLLNRYQEAIETYKEIDKWVTNQGVLFGIARCYHRLGDYHNELMTYLLIPIEQHNNTIRLRIVQCYESMGDPFNALQIIYNIPANQRDVNILMTLGSIYEKLGRYGEAAATYHSLPDHDSNLVAINSNARCLMLMGNYNQAVDLLSHVPNLEKDKKSLLNLTRCYEKMGRYDDGISTIKKIDNWEEDAQALRALAHIHQLQGYYSLAIQNYNKSIMLCADDYTYTGLAFCYEDMGYFEEAITTLNERQNQKERKAVMTLARCYQKAREYDLTIETFQSIPEWESDYEALLGIVQCYETMGRYDDAEAVYQSIPKEHMSQTLRLSEARYYEKTGQFDIAWLAYHDMLEKFPYFQEAALQFCRFVVKHFPTKADEVLDTAMKNWPFMSSLFTLRAQHQKHTLEKPQGIEKSIETLLDAIKLFPYFPDAYIALIKNYLELDNRKEAQHWVMRAQFQFSGHHKLFRQINEQMTHDGQDAIAALETYKPKIELPENIQKQLESLSQNNEVGYLVGSTVLTLLDQAELSSHQDVDMVTTAINIASLAQQGFGRNVDVPNCYILDTETKKYECFIVEDSETHPGHSLIETNAPTRDFTIACLYCNQDGEVDDPTQHGLSDHYNKILRTVNEDAEACFKEDPVRIVRALKYMMLGYRPLFNLDRAIKRWAPEAGEAWEKDYPRLVAVLKKQLRVLPQEDKLEFVQRLVDYGLITKLFDKGIKPALNVELTLLSLEEFLGLKPESPKATYVSAISYGRFHQPALAAQPVQQMAESSVLEV